jgi:YebC/PmpR family DNA-binding regulatory protein
MTDNRNRTAGEVRNVLTRYNGNLGASGSVGYMFKKQGVIIFDKTEVDENVLTDLAIELGADDIKSEVESVMVLTEPKEFERIREALKEKKIAAPVSAEVTMVPQTVVRLTGHDAEKAVKLVAALEDNDDVQNVYSNMDVDDSVLESVG